MNCYMSRQYYLWLICFILLGCVCFLCQTAVFAEDVNKEVTDLMDAHEYDKAIELAEKALSSNHDDIELYILLANTYFTKGRNSFVTVDTDYLESTQGKKGFYTIDGKNMNRVFGESAKYNIELVDKAISTLEEGLKIAPDRADVYFGICYLAQETQQHQKLIQTLQKALKNLELNDGIYNTMFGYAENYLQAQQYDKAKDIYETILSVSPDYERAVCNYGLTQFLNGNFQDSIETLKRAVVLDPKDSLAWSNLSTIYAFVGDYKSAVNAKQKLFETEKPKIWEYFSRAMLYLNLDEDNTKHNLTEYLALEQKEPDDPGIVSAAKEIIDILNGKEIDDDDTNKILGDMLDLKEASGLLSFIDYLLKKNPDYILALLSREGLYDSYNFDALSEKDAVRTISIYDKNPEAYSYITRDMLVINLTRSYLKQGLNKKAVELVSEIKDVKNNAYNIGRIYEVAEDYKNAYYYLSLSAANSDDSNSMKSKDALKDKVYDEYKSNK